MSLLRRIFGQSEPEAIETLDLRDDTVATRTVGGPLEGTNISLFNTEIPNFWAETFGASSTFGTPALADRVWVAARCQQLNAQTIAGFPIRFHAPNSPTAVEPAWVSSPDPNLFPNGIGDALFAIVDQLYGHGYSCQYVTDTYADGFPRHWTVLPSSTVTPKFEDGARVYQLTGGQRLDPRRIVQIDRNPTTAAHGTSALRAYAQTAWGLLAAGNQSMTVSQGGMPQFWIESLRKLTPEQALEIQTEWMAATARRNGAPPILPPELKPQQLSFNPSDLALLETQEWNARTLATAYGVPSVILNMALQGGLTYQNPIALMQMWWLTELRQTSKRIMDAFSAQMLPAGQWVSADASDITTDMAAGSADDDEQASQVAKASPAQQANVIPIRTAADPVVERRADVRFEEGAIQVAAGPVPSVHVDVHPGGKQTRRVTFSDGTTATMTEED